MYLIVEATSQEPRLLAAFEAKDTRGKYNVRSTTVVVTQILDVEQGG